MADGSYKTMADIKIGDMVLSYDIKTGESAPCKVTNRWEHGLKPIKKITFSDGESVYVEENHPFPVKLRSGKTWNRSKNSRHKNKTEIVKVVKKTVKELTPRLKNSIAMRTRMLSPISVKYSDGNKLPIHPYVLGVLLGDGSIVKKTALAITSEDSCIIERVSENLNGIVLISKRTNKISHGLIKASGLEEKLISLDLLGTKSGTKFVPQIYMSASYENRMQILAGLIDTDGFKYGFCVKSKRLASDFQKLIKSVGGKATIQEVEKTCTNAKGGPKKGIYYNVTWRAYDIPVELKYKMPARTKRNCDYSSRIVRSIEDCGTELSCCIEVDHPDHCFLIGDFIATCNSRLGGFVTSLFVTGEHPRYKSPQNGRAWIVGLDSKAIEAIQKPYFEMFMPKRWLDSGKYNGKHNYWTFDCEGRHWEVWFKSVDSGRKKFQGDKIDFGWVDEEPLKEGVFTEFEMRTIDNAAPWLMTATPVEGTRWLKETLERDDVFFTMAGMRENPYIPLEEIEKIASKLPKDERDVRIEGKYLIFGGRPVFDRNLLMAIEKKASSHREGILAVA